MSVTVDTNILLYASNADDELHERARELVEELAGGPDLLYVFWPTIMGFLRITTHPSVFPRPASPEQAMAAISSIPVVSPGLDLWSALEILERTGLDALLVSVGGEGTTLVTRRSAAKLVHDRAEVRHKALELGLPRKKGWFRGR